MATRHVLLALAIVVAWGLNFVVIEVGLRHFPPLLLAALRFLLVAVPAVAFVPRPAIRWRALALIGLFLGVGQFGLLFVGMSLGVSAGLASVVLQSQVVFTVVAGAVLLRDRLAAVPSAGVALAVVGLIAIGAGRGDGVSGPGLVLVVAAGASWAAANILTRAAGRVGGLSLVVWASLVPPVPLLLLSSWLEGPPTAEVVLQVGLVGWLALAYLVLVATLFGFGAWSHLLQVYSPAVVAPFTLLVPVCGLAAALLALGQVPTVPEASGAALLLVGVGVVLGHHARRRGRAHGYPPAALEALQTTSPDLCPSRGLRHSRS